MLLRALWLTLTLSDTVQNAGEGSVANIDKLRFSNGNVSTADLRLTMQKTMQEHAAVFRTGEVLREGCKKVGALFKQMDDIKVMTNGGCGLRIRQDFG